MIAMIKIPLEKNVDRNIFIKKELHTFTRNNLALTIKEFYLNFSNSKKIKENDVFHIHNKKDLKNLFNKLNNIIKGKTIKCLLKTNSNWFKVQLKRISKNVIQILFLKKLESKKVLQKIDHLKNTIKKLRLEGIHSSSINNYISHFFEYNFANINGANVSTK